MYKSLAMCLAATCFSAHASAQDTAGISDTKLVSSVSLGDLEMIVSSLGHEIVDENPDDVALIAVDGDGYEYFLDGTACSDDSTCQGINMFMTYDATADTSLASLNADNIKYAAVGVWQAKDYVGISRYVILDNGVTIGNIKANIRVLLSLGAKLTPSAAPTASTSNIDFGNDSGSYANDGTCDDSRFSGAGRSILMTDSHILKDASDCKSAYRAGTITIK